MPPVYHQASLNLLGVAPRTSSASGELLGRREQALGVRLPASVREWYTLRGAERVLAEHGGDRPVPLKALGDPREVGLGWLRVLDECQGVAAWFVRLDGSDDPPVYVHSEMFGTPEDDARARDDDEDALDPLVDFPTWWRPAAPSFSAFVYDRILKYGGDAATRAAVAALHDRSRQPSHHAVLDDRGRIVRVTLGTGYHSGPGHPEPDPQVPDHLLVLLRQQPHLRELTIGWELSGEGWAALRGHPRLARVVVRCVGCPAEAVATLTSLPALRSLDLDDVAITDDDLARLLGGVRLSEFQLFSERAPNRGLAAIGRQAELERLALIAPESLTDAGLSGVAGMSRLAELDLRGGRVTDDGLAHLAGLASLRELSLTTPKVTDAGLAHLAGLAGLEVFRLHAPKVTDAGLAHLAALTSMTTLALDGMRIRGAGFGHLGRLTGLRSLEVGDSPVGDAAMAHLAALPSLTELSLSDTRISNAALMVLATFPRLRELELHRNRLTADGLAHLAGAKGLQRLVISGVEGDTRPAIEALNRVRPDLKVEIR